MRREKTLWREIVAKHSEATEYILAGRMPEYCTEDLCWFCSLDVPKVAGAATQRVWG